MREGKLPSCHCAVPDAERAHLVAADLIDARMFAVPDDTGGGTILTLEGSIKCKSVHAATP